MKRSLLQLRNIGNATPLSHVRISATFPVSEKPGSLTSSSYLHWATPDDACSDEEVLAKSDNRSSSDQILWRGAPGAPSCETAALSGYVFHPPPFMWIPSLHVIGQILK
ncbi:hypothetical protein HID58_060799 [Brassica napus]|uniref:Uncharacterized protein n=1 Tax=Brassica napus TaxID=3708 RepID=A0ABQ7ZWY0_BRANA|nr:hypothetical protein HID58_060799 [Brassica napus]